MTRFLPWLVAAAVAGWLVRRRRRRPLPRPVRGLPELRSDTALIAAREVRQRLRGRMFRVVTLLLLAAVGAAIVIPAETAGGHPSTAVGVVGELTAPEREAVAAAGTAAGTTVRLVREPTQAAARVALAHGRVGLVVVAARTLLVHKAYAATDTSTGARLTRLVAALLGEQRAYAQAGLSPAQARQVAGARPLPVAAVTPAADTRLRGAAIVGLILLFVLLTQYATWTLTGVLEEKSSRVVEVLLATVGPRQLLGGKLLGIGLLVFAQAGLLVAFGLGLAGAVGSTLLQGAGPAVVASTLVWLVLGYAFYSWLYAAAGSLAQRQEQVQLLALPLSIPMIVGYVLALTGASSGSASALLTVLAYLPGTSPFAMPVLVGLRAVSWWQFGLSAGISLLATLAVARAAAAVYERAVLRTGPLRLRAVLRRDGP